MNLYKIALLALGLFLLVQFAGDVALIRALASALLSLLEAIALAFIFLVRIEFEGPFGLLLMALKAIALLAGVYFLLRLILSPRHSPH